MINGSYRENWQPDLTDRKAYETWKMDGAMSMGQRAKEKVRHILDNYRPQPLPAEVDAEIDRILQKAEKAIVHRRVRRTLRKS